MKNRRQYEKMKAITTRAFDVKRLRRKEGQVDGE
jgi:hypothetical protein